MIIKTKNILADSAQSSFLSNPEVAGTNILRWKNPDAFVASWAMQVGATGEEQSEVVLLSASTPAGTAGTLSGSTLYNHSADTPLYAIKYDQVVFERSTTGTTGTATPIANGTVNLTVDSVYTQFDDVGALTTYAYKTYFRSSALSVNSSESDWITSSGFSFYSLAAIQQRIRDRLWTSKFLTDDMLTDWINEWKDELTNSVIEINEDYALGTVDIPFGTAGFGTISNSDFKQVKRLWITYDGINYFKSTKMDSNFFRPNQVFSASTPYHYYQGDNIFVVNPQQSGGTARTEYYKLNVRLVNDTDELPVPMRGYTKSFVDYGEYLALMKDGKSADAQVKFGAAQIGKQSFITESTPRDKTGQDFIQVVEPLSGDNDYIY